MIIRKIEESDFEAIVPIVNEWWEGREVSELLPRLFFIYFQNTSFIVEEKGKIIAFLIGFVSQTNSNEAYIHFVGVHPEHRNRKIGKMLYEHFFNIVNQLGCDTVRCITSPVNKNSILFHTGLGFYIENGNNQADGVHVFKDYAGAGKDRVLFTKRLDKDKTEA